MSDDPAAAANSLADRIDTLETRLTYQDAAIDTLNTAITAQWQQIDALARQLAALSERLQEAEAATAAGPANELPRIIDRTQ